MAEWFGANLGSLGLIVGAYVQIAERVCHFCVTS